MISVSLTWSAIGISTGYWIGTDATTERMVSELMRRIRERKINDRLATSD